MKNNIDNNEISVYLNEVLACLEEGHNSLNVLAGILSRICVTEPVDASFQEKYKNISNQVLSDAEDIFRTCEQHIAKMDYIEEKVLEASQDIEEIIADSGLLSIKSQQNIAKISDLKKYSNQIEMLGGSVIGISQKTNLLAFNVAIEVSNTDSEAKCLSVLSEEIRRLADLSASSAKDISTLIRGLNKSLQKVIKSAHQNGESMRLELKKIEKPVLTFNTIQENLKQMFQSGKKIRSISREALSGSLNIRQSSESFLELKNQMVSKKNQINELVNKQNIAYSDTILFAEYIKANIDEAEQLTTMDNLNHFIDMCKSIMSDSDEVERILNDLFYNIDAYSLSFNNYEESGNSLSNKVTVINEISKSDQKKISLLSSELEIDFNELNNISKGIQNILLENSETLRNFYNLNLRSWKIARIIDSLISNTTMSKMLAFNLSLETSRIDESLADYDDLVRDTRHLSGQSEFAAENIKKIMNQIDYLVSNILDGINENILSSGKIMEKVKRVIRNLAVIKRNITFSNDYVVSLCIFSGVILKNIGELERHVNEFDKTDSLSSVKDMPINDIFYKIRSAKDECVKPLNNINAIAQLFKRQNKNG